MMNKHRPQRDVSGARLDKRIANGAMRTLDYSVGLRIISRNPNIKNMVLLGKPIQCCDKRSSVVHNNFSQSTPATENLLKYEGTESVHCLSAQHLPFRPCR